ncbi:MAG: cysteine desulfurase [Streptococcaceae bacterium]|jgi:cysteine desulfurase|nr:cysteine desulfurase [Streptococcaceae bacterium]
MIYLDNAATTPVLSEVADSMATVLRETYGNPSSIHAAGRNASKLLRESRETIAKHLAVPANTLTFTSGASEANNLALVGYALANQDKGKHLVTTAIEHPSILQTLSYLRDRFGFDVTFVKPLPDGTFPAHLITDQLRDDTILVSVMHANNETGQLLPISEIGEVLQTHQAAFHVDAVQSLGKLPIHPEELHADFLTASAHKFHGPKGIGFLYHRAGLHFDALIHGGEQEDKRRAGTENLAAIVGMAKAIEVTSQLPDKTNVLYTQLLTGLETLKAKTAQDFYLNAPEPHLSSTLNIGFPNVNHDILLTKLDLAGICVSTGSACTAGTVEPSHVLEAIYGKESPKLKENIRVSFSKRTQKEDIDALLSALYTIFRKD